MKSDARNGRKDPSPMTDSISWQPCEMFIVTDNAVLDHRASVDCDVIRLSWVVDDSVWIDHIISPVRTVFGAFHLFP
jgi:hypothetical protein